MIFEGKENLWLILIVGINRRDKVNDGLFQVAEETLIHFKSQASLKKIPEEDVISKYVITFKSTLMKFY